MTDTAASRQASRLGVLVGGLRHRDYALLLTIFLITQTGFWLSTVALQWQTARLTDSDPFLLGLLYFCNLVPLLLLSPVGGTLADRFDRRRLVIAGQLATAALAGALVGGLGTVGPSLPLLFGFAVGIGTTMAMMAPANSALMVNAVPLKDLRSAISLQAATMNVARMIGPAIAGMLLAAFGAWSAFTGYLLTSVAAGVALLAVRVPAIEIEQDHSRLLHRIRAGVRHARERQPALPALLLVAAVAFLGSSYVPLLAVYAFEVLEGGDAAFTLFFVISGVGALVGALSNGLRRQPLSVRGAMVLALVLGGALIVFALSRDVALSAGALAVVAAANFAVMTALNVVVQSVVDESQRGRVMSLYIVAWGGLVPLGSLSVGAVAAAIGPTAALLAYGAVLLAVNLGGLLWYRPGEGAAGA
jgi:predicted MFS family arabinose efflux permease